MGFCWELKGCPASHYLSCAAYEKKEPCWEIKKGCLCQAYSACNFCQIFLEHQEKTKTAAG